ncbi:unannotated protein [freshwater metagenome]|uniref:Unannotated protein n=1 Tax=freshwater metagenome TaxID=449393 RepID=A0A6J7DMU9_9ZZZZ
MPASNSAVASASARTRRDISHRAYDGAAETISPAGPMMSTTFTEVSSPSRLMTTAGPIAACDPAMSSPRQVTRWYGIIERARATSAPLVSLAISGRCSRKPSARAVSSSRSGKEVAVRVQVVRSAMRWLTSALMSDGESRCGGASGWLPKKAASMPAQPMPLRMPTSRAMVTFT